MQGSVSSRVPRLMGHLVGHRRMGMPVDRAPVYPLDPDWWPQAPSVRSPSPSACPAASRPAASSSVW